MRVRPAKTQISPGIRPVWSESSLSAWRNNGPLATNWTQVKTLIRLGGCPGWSKSSLGAHVILLVLSWGGSFLFVTHLSRKKKEKKERKKDWPPVVFGTVFCRLYCFPIWTISWDYGIFVLRKLILHTRMRSHPVRLDVWFQVGPFVYFDASCVRTAKALARLRECAVSPVFAGRLCDKYHNLTSWIIWCYKNFAFMFTLKRI